MTRTRDHATFPSRRARLVQIGAIVTAAAGWLYIFFGGGPGGSKPAPVTLPELEIVTDASGVKSSRLDYGAWLDACRSAGVLDPPDPNGGDPETVRIVIQTVKNWIQTGQPAFLGKLGQVYLALDMNDASLDCFAAAAHLEPNQVLWRYYLGIQCQTLGHADAAIEILSEVAQRDPDYAVTFARLGSMHLDRAELKKAEERYEQFCARQPNQSLGYVGLGRVALAHGDSGAAEGRFRKAISVNPRDFLAFRMLSRALALNGKPDEARRTSAISVQLPEYRGWLPFDDRLREANRVANSPQHLENEMRRFLSAGDFRNAAESATRLLERRPRDADLWANLAGMYQGANQPAKATQAIARAVDLNPDSTLVRTVQAEVAFSQQDMVDARSAVDALLNLNPKSSRGHELRGRLRFLSGEVEGGLGDVRTSIQLDPSRREPQGLFASMLVQAGRKQEAVEFLQGLIRENPEDITLRQWLDHIK